MSFLFPLALGGVVLVGVPILVHLILRQKPRTLQFPAFRFLLQRHRTNLRKLRLRHLLLLALRVFIILMLFLALSQPKWTATEEGWGKDRPVAVVFVLDTSPRMGREWSPKKTQLGLVQEKVQGLLDELNADSKVLILDSGARFRTKGEDEKEEGDAPPPDKPPTWVSPAEARSLVAAMKVRTSSRPLGEKVIHGLDRLEELAREGAGRSLPRFLCVFSDRTHASWKLSMQDDIAQALARIPPTFEGLQAARAELPELIERVQELRTKLPSLATYVDQPLLDALNELRSKLTSLTREDAGSAKLAVVPLVLQKGRELIAALDAVKGKSEDEAYRERLVQQMDTLLGKLRGVRCRYFDVGLDEPVDLGIIRVETPLLSDGAPRQVFTRNEKWLLRVVVRSSGKDQAATVLCKVRGHKKADGTEPDEQVLQTTMDFLAGKDTTVPFEIDNGALAGESGFLQIEVSLKVKDQYAFNNQAFQTIALQPARRVLVIADSETQATPFTRALESLGFKTEVKTPKETLALERLAYDAVYLFQSPRPGAALWSALEAFVTRGGKLGVVPGGKEILLDGSEDAYDGPIARRLLPGRLVGQKESEDPGAAWDLEDESVFQHPMMRPFRMWRKMNIDFIRFKRGAFQYWEVEPRKDALVVVNYADGAKHPALLELPPNAGVNRLGTVLLFTTPLDERTPPANNYLEKLTSFYVVLVGLSTYHLAGEMERLALNFSTDAARAPTWKMNPRKSYVNYRLQGPDLRRVHKAPEEGDEIAFPEAVVPGNYQVLGLTGATPKEIVGALSVNLPGSESDLRRLDARTIDDVFGGSSVLPINHETETSELFQGYQSEDWPLLPILMIAILFLLAGENLLANLFYRREKQPAVEHATPSR